MKEPQAAAAFGRFGLGPRRGDPGRGEKGADALLRQLADPAAALIQSPGLLGREEAAQAFVESRVVRLREVARMRAAAGASEAPAAEGESSMGRARPPRRAAALPDAPDGPVRPPRLYAADELRDRVDRAVATDAPLLERLAMHWANHFTVSLSQPRVTHFIGPFERESVRPHMLGRFSDLLVAACLDPAMLIYLDNRRSVGPSSKRGAGGRRGLNENLAREILELHALGVDGGYAQADVQNLARALTGWTVDLSTDSTERRTRVGFDPDMHEPGAVVVLGKRYPEGGAEQAVSILRDLGRHPSAARHVARRMAEHFVAKPAPAPLVARLERAFLDTEGDLTAVTKALVTAPEALSEPPRKLRPPLEFLLAAARLLGQRPEPPALEPVLTALGQPYFKAAVPKGWPEENDAWAAPDALKSRLDWAAEFSARGKARVDARALAREAFGDALSGPTARAVERASSGPQALTLLLMSPEMQRR